MQWECMTLHGSALVGSPAEAQAQLGVLPSGGGARAVGLEWAASVQLLTTRSAGAIVACAREVTVAEAAARPAGERALGGEAAALDGAGELLLLHGVTARSQGSQSGAAR